MMKMNCITALENKVFQVISDVSSELSVPAYVVGGFVRDYLLNIKNDDIDIVVEGSGIEFAKYFANKVNGKLSYYENYGTAMVKWEDIEVEFVGARKEMYERGSRNPIVEEGTLFDDISRRDFTINAMAISLNKDTYGDLVDFFGGLKDLNAHILRTPLNPDMTFSDDPLRMFRAVRFISKLADFTIDEKTIEGIKTNAYRSTILTRERITMELEKMLSYTNPTDGLILLHDLGLWDYAFPDNEYSINNVKAVGTSFDIDVRWFFLAYNYDGSYDSFTRAMKLPNKQSQMLDKMYYTYNCFSRMDFPHLSVVRHCLEYSGYYAFKGLDSAFIYLQLTQPNNSANIVDWYGYTTSIFHENSAFVNYNLICNGDEISEWSGLQPGILLGKLIKTVKEKILDGELNNSRDSIYAYVRHNKMCKNF